MDAYRWVDTCRSLCVALVAVILAAPFPAHGQSFYEASPVELHGRPGTIVRSEPMAGAPAGASAFRVLYRSTGLAGEPIAVSGVIVVPPGPAPAGGRHIVAWAHPTTGVAQRCAPSLLANMYRWVPGLDDMLARGFVVAATDYPGLGTPGPHPYLVGVSEGRAVLDSVRAARALPQAGASNRFGVWGHSQGGHAALFTGEIAREYAPDLHLVGVAAAAPATRLVELFEADIDSPSGRILASMALYSWSRVFKVPLDDVVDRAALPAFERTAQQCGESVIEAIMLRLSSRPLAKRFLQVDLSKQEPWRSIMVRNTPERTLSGAPLLIAQGLKDAVVQPPVTKAYMKDLCRQGTRVRLVTMPEGIHAVAARDSASAAVAWMAERFAGGKPPDDCAGS